MEDEQFEELLANYDEALAQGATPVNSTSPKDAALRERLAEAQACLDLLESAFPRHPPSTLDARLGQTAFSTLYTQPLTIGRFDIRRELGRGGHGVVFLAYDTALKREVALKVPRPDILQSVDMRSRFRREAEAAARLQHPNLIPLYEAGEIGPVCYLVSEFCPGPNLATWLSRHAAPIAPKSVIRLVAALADAVGYMHQQGVLHRDIKPGNIILQFPVALPPELANPQDNYPDADFAIPRITDFGLAHFVEDVAIHTSTGIIVGTPGHMAPEQIEGKRDEVGPPADVYALGVIIYLLLTRRLPVEGATDFETLKRISTDDPVSLRRLRREVPRDLETVVLKCLEKRPARRYPAASDLADDLRRVLAGEAIQARRASSLERLRKWARRKPALFVACAAAILSLAISGGAVAWFADYRQTEAVKIDSLIQKLRDNDTRRQEIESLRTIEEYPKNVMLAWLTWAKGKNGHELQTTLRSHAEKVREYDLAGFEWHYLKHLAFSAATELLPSHHGNVTSLAISPDSHFLMSYALDHKAQLWNLKLDQAPKVVSLNDGAEKKDFQFSPDSREVAILESRDKVSTIDRWDVPSGTRLDHWEFDGRVDGIQFAPDRSGLYFTLRRDTGHQICFRRFGSGTASFVDRFLLPEDSLISIQDFQTIRGGSQLLVASVEADGHLPLSLRLVDVETGKLWSESFVIGTSASPPLRADFSLTVSTDETKAAISFQSGQIHWRSLETKSMPLSFVFPQRRVHSTNFSSDGKTLGVGTSDSNGPGARITLLDVETGKQTDELELSRINTWSLTATPDWNTVYQGGASNIYVNHRKQTATQSSEKIILPGHGMAEVWGVAFSPDGKRLVSSGDDGCVKVWNTTNWRLERNLADHGSLVPKVTYDPFGKTIASVDFDGKLVIWDNTKLEKLQELRETVGTLRAIAYSPNNMCLAFGGQLRQVWIWDTTQPSSQPRSYDFGIRDGNIESMMFTPDSKRLFIASTDTGLRYLTLSTDEISHLPLPDRCRAIAMNPRQNQMAVGFENGVIQYYDLSTLHEISSHQAHSHTAPEKTVILTLAFTPDGRTLASAGMDGTVKVWHVETNQELLRFENVPCQVNQLTFSPDGLTLAAALHNGEIWIWNAK